MHAPWPRLVVAVLLAASPFAAQAADTPAPAEPQRLVVDSESAPVLSIQDTVQLVEIVLVPSGDYHPVHPDSVEADGDDGPVDPDAAPAK